MSKADVSTRTAEALADAGLADMRPTYRALLLRLRDRDPSAFEDATTRYEETVAAAIDGGQDVLAAWISYGAWIAERVSPGRLVSIDESGLADEPVGSPSMLAGHLLLHLPEAPDQTAVPIARPSTPSPAQQSALELLVR